MKKDLSKKEFDEVFVTLHESWYEGQENRSPDEALKYALHYFGVVLDEANRIKKSGAIGFRWLDVAIYEACKRELTNITQKELSKIPEEYTEIINRINEMHTNALEHLEDIFNTDDSYPGNRPD